MEQERSALTVRSAWWREGDTSTPLEVLSKWSSELVWRPLWRRPRAPALRRRPAVMGSASRSSDTAGVDVSNGRSPVAPGEPPFGLVEPAPPSWESVTSV